MAGAKSKTRRKPVAVPVGRAALEEEDWDTKSARILREHFGSSERASATSEDDSSQEEGWEMIQKKQRLHEADPAGAVRRWRELWEQRVPGGSKELEELSGSFHYYSDVLEVYSHPDNFEEDSADGSLFRLWKALYDTGLPEVCTMIARDDGLFNENEVWG